MEIHKLQKKIPKAVYALLEKRFQVLRPSQAKAIKQGLFKGNNMLICTPTASGKTLVGEMGFMHTILENHKAVYVVPLRALASEKFREFKGKYPSFKVGLSSGDLEASDKHLADCDLIITTSEKLDSLLRHKTSWIKDVGVLVVDEVHLMNDASRGPTLEIIITLLRMLLPKIQIIALSATIGNPEELATWLQAELVLDDWRPVRLDQGVYMDGKIEFYK